MLEQQLALLDSKNRLAFGYIHYLDPEGRYQAGTGVPDYDSLEGKEGFIRLLKLNYIPIFTVLAQKAANTGRRLFQGVHSTAVWRRL